MLLQNQYENAKTHAGMRREENEKARPTAPPLARKIKAGNVHLPQLSGVPSHGVQRTQRLNSREPANLGHQVQIRQVASALPFNQHLAFY